MFKRIIKKLFNQSGYTIYKNTENPHDPFVQQGKLFDRDAPLTIFDVGANYGQTVARYKTLFPNSTVYAFEPHPEAYLQLKNNTDKYKNNSVQCYELALGNDNGTADFFVNTYSETSSLLKNSELGKQVWGQGAMKPAGNIPVEISTLDNFVKVNQVLSIDILKLDTQGTEYQIIEGADWTLSQNKVKMIYTEIITLHTYNNQKEIHELLKLLFDYSFRVYGFYEHYYYKKKLSYVNALFIQKDF